MASSHNVLVLIALCISSLFLYSSQTNVKLMETTSSDLLEMVCSPSTDIQDWNYNLCLSILRSSPKVVNATDHESLVLEIIDLGLQNSSNIYDYISNRLNNTGISAPLKSALNECLSYYDDAIYSMSVAYGEIKQVGEYYDGRDDLVDSLDEVGEFDSCMSGYKFDEPVISNGIKLFKYFCVPAMRILEMLLRNNYPPTA